MTDNFIASSCIAIQASADRVWSVLTDPLAIREFMFGTDVVTDWTVGGPIAWRGIWKGKAYEDKGVILEFEPGRRLVNTHFSPLSGQDDEPGNYHTLTWTLEPEGAATKLTLTQDNNASADEAAHSKGMWDSLVESVKNIAERN
ncbi:SRPBCC domain-containing protein [Arthrobacter sp. FW306-04-A]|uniref:SRPBCC domain-containing protein n=1 Tax=Arthrobacter sp. FW306-04-A TaxID=2879619 RepID=UPI0037BFA32B|nr:SRPBCC domain-containing protein [Arthrobacter sp. FW306-04-A]